MAKVAVAKVATAAKAVMAKAADPAVDKAVRIMAAAARVDPAVAKAVRTPPVVPDKAAVAKAVRTPPVVVDKVAAAGVARIAAVAAARVARIAAVVAADRRAITKAAPAPATPAPINKDSIGSAPGRRADFPSLQHSVELGVRCASE